MEQKKDKLLATIVHYKGLEKEREKKISEILSQISTLKMQSTTIDLDVIAQTTTTNTEEKV